MSVQAPQRPSAPRSPSGAPTGTPTARPALTVADRANRVRFRRALSLMAMTLLLPGSAQITAGTTARNRLVGRLALYVWATLLAVVLGSVLVAALHHQFAFWLVSDLGALQLVRLGLMVLAVGWAALLVDAWRLGSPLSLSLNHRRAAVGVNGVLCFSVTAVLLFGAHLVGVQRSFIADTFGGGAATGAHDGRYNVLLIGGDSGVSRWGLRPDSMTVASIDAITGKSVLIGLPRNMTDFPFAKGSVMRRAFPQGFHCETDPENCMLNGVYTWALDHTKLWTGTGKAAQNPGLDAVLSAVSGITGLKLNYYAMVNLQGFRNLVNAFGGVTVNVRQPIPVGGLGSDVTGYIQPGVKKLSGDQALWYARSRDSSDDYSRMARQKCLMNDMLDQVQPQVVVENFQKIAQASSAMVSTSIPASEVDHFMDLAIKAKGQKISTLSLVPPLVDTAHPDIPQIHQAVQAALGHADGSATVEAKAPATSAAPAASTASSGTSSAPASSAATQPAPSAKAKKKQSQEMTGGSYGSLHDGYVANQTSDLGSAC